MGGSVGWLPVGVGPAGGVSLSTAPGLGGEVKSICRWDMGKQQKREKKVKEEQPKESTANRIWHELSPGFFFPGPFLDLIFRSPGEKLNCFYTGQLPDAPMAPLLLRWLQAPPEARSNYELEQNKSFLEPKWLRVG